MNATIPAGADTPTDPDPTIAIAISDQTPAFAAGIQLGQKVLRVMTAAGLQNLPYLERFQHYMLSCGAGMRADMRAAELPDTEVNISQMMDGIYAMAPAPYFALTLHEPVRPRLFARPDEAAQRSRADIAHLLGFIAKHVRDGKPSGPVLDRHQRPIGQLTIHRSLRP